VYVVVRRGHSVLLMLREGTGYKDGCWGLPSGKVERGETYEAAAIRELAEETGLSLDASELHLAMMLDRLPSDGGHWVGAFFDVVHRGQEPRNAEPTKCRELGWYSLFDLPNTLVDYVRHAVLKSAEGERYAVWQDAEHLFP